MSAYTQLLQKLLDEAGPDPETLKRLRQQATEYLDVLARDTERLAFRDEAVVYDLIFAYFMEKYANNGFRVIKGKPVMSEDIILYQRPIGRAPESYQIIILYRPGYVDIYYAHTPSNNLRAAYDADADICA